MLCPKVAVKLIKTSLLKLVKQITRFIVIAKFVLHDLLLRKLLFIARTKKENRNSHVPFDAILLRFNERPLRLKLFNQSIFSLLIKVLYFDAKLYFKGFQLLETFNGIKDSFYVENQVKRII